MMTTTPSVALSSAATPAQAAVSDGLIVARVTTLSNSTTPPPRFCQKRIARRGSHPARLVRQQKGRGDNATQHHVGVQRGGGFCGCHARGGLPLPASHRG